jgi:hypothetical protein
MRRVSAGSQIVFTMTSECWKSHCLLFSGLGFETRYECRARPSLITKSIVAGADEGRSTMLWRQEKFQDSVTPIGSWRRLIAERLLQASRVHQPEFREGAGEGLGFQCLQDGVIRSSGKAHEIAFDIGAHEAP